MNFETAYPFTASTPERHTALDFTREEISAWSNTTQSVSKLSDAHFKLFLEMESKFWPTSKRNKALKALGILQRAAEYLRLTCDSSDLAAMDWDLKNISCKE